MTFDDALLRSLSTIMPVNEAGRIFEALISNGSLENGEHLDTLMGSDVLDSSVLGRSSASRISTHLQNHHNFTPEPYISLAMPFLRDDLPDVSSNGYVFSQLRRAREGDTDLWKTNAQSNRDSPQESRLDCNPPQQIPSQQQILHPVPQLRGIEMEIPNQGTRVLVHDRGNKPETYASICSRRLKQYFSDMRNNTHNNGLSYWKKFISEYYAPGSKKRWCFCKHKNIELPKANVFGKSMETYCCQICGLKSVKGLEATSEVLPRLLKVQVESGMLDEFMCIGSPQVFEVPRGLVAEFGKVVQWSVYQTFHVVHNGRLRIVFRPDLKILSWEFCIENHEVYLPQSLFTPQVNQLVHAVKKYQDIQNRVPYRAASDLQKVCDTFVEAGLQIKRGMELPLVDELGYPKRFIRCLQISEVVDSMKDLMTLSQVTEMGAVDCLSTYSKGRTIRRSQGTVLTPMQPSHTYRPNVSSMTEDEAISSELENSNLTFRQLLGQNSYPPTIRQYPDQEVALSSRFQQERRQVSHQAQVDRMLHEMAPATTGRSKRPNLGAAQQSTPRPSDNSPKHR